MSLEFKLKKALDSNDELKIHNVFNEIYCQYGKLIYFIVIKDIENKQDAEEITQDVFLNFFNTLDKSKINNIKYYLIKTSKNLIINYLKSKNKQIELNDYLLISNDKKYNDEYEKIINKMKKYLTDYEVEIILKHIIDDYSFKELAKNYKKSINTIFATYNRAIMKIRKGENING